MAWNAGVRWQRILFYWDAIQPEWNGQSLPNRFANDAVIQNELNRGFKLVGCFGCPPKEPHERYSRSMRLSTSLCSTNSPLSACSMPFCTPAMNRA